MSKGTIIAFTLVFLIAGVAIVRGERFKREAQVAQANYAAALDTTRTVRRESVAARTRLATQAAIATDSLSRALAEALGGRDAALRALQRTRITLDSVTLLAQTPVTDTVIVERGDTVRVATFPLEGPPISGTQVVRVNNRITLDSRLQVSPFTITFGVGCSQAAPVFTWDTPDWVNADFAGGTVDPVVCNPPPASLFSFGANSSIWFAGGSLVTLLLTLLAR